MIAESPTTNEVYTKVRAWMNDLMQLPPAVRREIGERLIQSAPKPVTQPICDELIEQHIHDRGRGPEIKGTRITVYDVMDYYTAGWRFDQIAGTLGVPSDQVQAALAYIELNKAAVTRDYEKILERHRNYEYPPEVKKKLQRSREKFQARVAEIRARASAGGDDAGTHGG